MYISKKDLIKVVKELSAKVLELEKEVFIFGGVFGLDHKSRIKNIMESVDDNGKLLDMLFKKLKLKEVVIEKHTKLVKTK